MSSSASMHALSAIAGSQRLRCRTAPSRRSPQGSRTSRTSSSTSRGARSLSVTIRLMDGHAARRAHQELRSLRGHRRSQRGTDHMIFKHAIAAIQLATRRRPTTSRTASRRPCLRRRPSRASSSSSSTASASASCPTRRSYGDAGSNTLGNIAQRGRCGFPCRARVARAWRRSRRSATRACRSRRPAPRTAAWRRRPQARTR